MRKIKNARKKTRQSKAPAINTQEALLALAYLHGVTSALDVNRSTDSKNAIDQLVRFVVKYGEQE